MQGKVVIITGASSGIGRATAIEFARRGASVSISARRKNELDDLQKEITSAGGKCFSVVADVSSEEDCRKIISETVMEFGKLDVLVNNAGISMRAMFNELEIGVIQKLMAVNFWGTVFCTKQALPHLLKTKGSIVGVSSIAGFKGLPARTGYSASKFAMQGFLESVRIEHLHDGLHVLLICPGFTASNIRNIALNSSGNQQGDSPLEEKKLMSAEQVAFHLVNGVIRKKRTIILTTQGKLTVLLNKFFPAMMDRLVWKHFAKEPDSPLGKK